MNELTFHDEQGDALGSAPPRPDLQQRMESIFNLFRLNQRAPSLHGE